MLVRDVQRVETRSGKTRWVLADDTGREYTTFRPRIGEEAERYTGRRAQITFHEEERNGFQNVYLDAIRPGGEPEAAGSADDADEVAWGTADRAERGDPARRALRQARAVQAAGRGGHPRGRRP